MRIAAGMAARAAALAAGMLALAAFEPARAADEETGDGVLIAFACGVVPRNVPVEVQPPDDTPAQTALRDVVVAELRRSGIAVAAGAPVRVTFEGGMERDLASRGVPRYGEITGHNDRFELRFRLWSSSEDSVIGGRRDEADRPQANRYRLGIFINDRTNGRCLWQGEALHDVEGADETVTARRMVPVLLRHLGQTVRQRAFTLDEP
jgi:hypothetical protein